MTWAERLVADVSLRAFVDAQIGQAAVELAALKVEVAHLQNVIQAQRQELEQLRPKGKRR